MAWEPIGFYSQIHFSALHGQDGQLGSDGNGFSRTRKMDSLLKTATAVFPGIFLGLYSTREGSDEPAPHPGGGVGINLGPDELEIWSGQYYLLMVRIAYQGIALSSAVVVSTQAR